MTQIAVSIGYSTSGKLYWFVHGENSSGLARYISFKMFEYIEK